MMKKWLLTMKRADFEGLSKTFGISPITARILRNRDVEEEKIGSFLHGTLSDCHSPFLMADMEKAAAIIKSKIEAGEAIRIIGDYDADGICAAFILYAGLTALGAACDTVIPHRIKDGYGLNEQLLEEACAEGIDTILTCDNGISAAEQIQRAKELGMTVIVTDHHEVPFRVIPAGREEILPCADAVVNPKRQDCTYPYKNICGAVIAYKLVQALFRKTERTDKELFDELLQYAALATVCDVMELLEENRIFVKEGLKSLRQKPAPGLAALMQVNKIEPEKVSAYHLGFVLGPCLNATGRLDTALRAMELLKSRERAEAVTAAQELKELNENRKLLTARGVEQASETIERERLQEEKVLVVYLPDCHESIAGIIAGRIRDRYYRPAFVLTDAQEGVKGSGRSIEGYHMYEALEACSKYLEKYGGHKMAAGFSLKKENIGAFRRCLNEACPVSAEEMVEPVHIDIALPLGYADLTLAKELKLLEPFGPGNKKPLFARKNLQLLGTKRMGSKGEYVRLQVRDTDEAVREMVYFGDAEELLQFLEEKGGNTLTCAYQLDCQTYRKTEEARLTLIYYD